MRMKETRFNHHRFYKSFLMGHIQTINLSAIAVDLSIIVLYGHKTIK
jgi:hypothetical protein